MYDGEGGGRIFIEITQYARGFSFFMTVVRGKNHKFFQSHFSYSGINAMTRVDIKNVTESHVKMWEAFFP